MLECLIKFCVGVKGYGTIKGNVGLKLSIYSVPKVGTSVYNLRLFRSEGRRVRYKL